MSEKIEEFVPIPSYKIDNKFSVPTEKFNHRTKYMIRLNKKGAK